MAVVLVIALLTATLGKGKDTQPEAMQASSPQESAQESTPAWQPTDTDIPTLEGKTAANYADEPKEVPQENTDDDRAARAALVLDDIVNDPVLTREEFHSISERLQADAGLTPDDSIADVYDRLFYAGNLDVLVSRSQKPVITDKGNGLYSVKYSVAAIQVPDEDNDGKLDNAVHEAVLQEVKDRLNFNTVNTVEFEIDFNTNSIHTIYGAPWWH